MPIIDVDVAAETDSLGQPACSICTRSINTSDNVLISLIVFTVDRDGDIARSATQSGTRPGRSLPRAGRPA